MKIAEFHDRDNRVKIEKACISPEPQAKGHH